MKRQEPELAGRFRKDPTYEEFLFRLNEALGPHQEQDYEDLPERFPTVHVIGAPRSGTTLALQLICAHLGVGFINNLIAGFWRAPVYGIRLSQRLISSDATISYRSEYGRTASIHEPHEFGYFWSRLLRYETMDEKDGAEENNIDWANVRLVLNNMTHAMGRPIVFKSPLVGWHIAKMKQTLPRSCFVVVRRDPLLNALSILRLRRQYYGSVQTWGNLKPRQYEELKSEPYSRQIVGQLYYLERAVDDQVARIDRGSVVQLDYDQLCAAPLSALGQVRDLLKRNGADVEMHGEPPQSFEPRPISGDDEEIERLREQVEQFYGGTAEYRAGAPRENR